MKTMRAAAGDDAVYNGRPAILGGKKGRTMRKLVTASVAVAALAFSGFMADGAIAQDKKAGKGAAPPTIKVVAENAKVVATETTYAPGAESNTSRAETRVVRALAGGHCRPRRHPPLPYGRVIISSRWPLGSWK